MGESGQAYSIADHVVGIYRYKGLAAVTYHRLTLSLDREFTFDDWQDLGGRWTQCAIGSYVVEDATVRLLSSSPCDRALIKGKLAIRWYRRALTLVPERSLSEFDKSGGNGDIKRREMNCPFEEGYSLFVKEPLPRAVVCIDPGVFGHALSAGKRYLVLEERHDLTSLRIFGDNGRLRWFPSICFEPPAQHPTT